MSGTEVALIRLATTVLGAVAKSLLTPRPGAGLVTDPVRPLPRPAKPDRLAKVLGGRLAESYADLPEHERLAALASVQDTFASAGELGAERLFALELEPDRLRAHPERVTVRIEQALGRTDRLLLRGPAGSGKSTLVQWLALNAARRTFGDELAEWNRCVPFVLRLRAFTAQETLPAPEDFLRAAGIPLHGAAPSGWVDRLLTDGRALVLVDGVDEVPQRLRNRTERWLKDLIAAYPRARYVVTTRPSAVPEGWLSGAGFEAHTLLAMERDDIRAFVGHWHQAARSECRSPEERDELDTYESSLRHAVGTRRDLGRLATNPLMCALLCALNRDRRMQLPRARKELYDAALDMLLVRRDSEREIIGVEGVDLTREEQTALLQRLAYWLIRNGLAEAEHGEVAAMLAEWMASMSQVRGTPEQVFAHLLIRSGLLREPAPGAVGFVHRTFQDYLGAKAAVEARDFGVLVRHAHDDQWDDVVQMAVGHARVEERATILRPLLRRADAEPEHEHRLVLLAAACLAHAAELDPSVRALVEERTELLLPPGGPKAAEELAKIGDLALELLSSRLDGLTGREAAAVVRTAATIGGDSAFELVRHFRDDEREAVEFEVSTAWGRFDAVPYAREIMAARTWGTMYAYMDSAAQLAALPHVPHVRSAHIQGDHPDLTPILRRPDMERIFVFRNSALTDTHQFAQTPRLHEVGLSTCPQVRDIGPLARPGLERLSLIGLHESLDSTALKDMPDLRQLALGHPLLLESIAELPVCEQLTSLDLFMKTRYPHLESLAAWSNLRKLGLHGSTHLRQLSRVPALHGLEELQLRWQSALSLGLLAPLTRLRSLALVQCDQVDDLAPLRELPALTSLRLYGADDRPIDLGPLAGLEHLTVHVAHGTPVIGTELFTQERIVHLP